MEGLDLGNGDEDDDGLLSTLDVDLLGGADLQLPQLGLEVWDILLEVEKSLGDLLLNLGRGSLRGVGGPLDFVLEGHFGLSEVSVLEDWQEKGFTYRVG